MTLLTHIVPPMKMIRPLAVAASLALVVAACGSDDDSSADTTAATPEITVDAVTVPEATDSTEPATTDAATESSVASSTEVTATLTVGEDIVEAEVVECSLEGTALTFTAQGETSDIAVKPLYGTYVGVIVTGDFEFEGSGDAAIEGDTVTITGSGALPDPSLPTTTFELVADISSC